jgi:nucleoside-triphosphatase
LTGDIQVGKSTIIKTFLNNYSGVIGGFKTEPVFTKNNKKVFVLKSLNNFTGKLKESKLICTFSEEKGRLIPLTNTFEDLGVRTLQECLSYMPDVIIMDELGIFESEAFKFQEEVYNCLASSIPVLGVIKNKESQFLNELRARKDILVMNVTLGNRELQSTSFIEYCRRILRQK